MQKIRIGDLVRPAGYAMYGRVTGVDAYEVRIERMGGSSPHAVSGITDVVRPERKTKISRKALRTWLAKRAYTAEWTPSGVVLTVDASGCTCQDRTFCGRAETFYKAIIELRAALRAAGEFRP